MEPAVFFCRIVRVATRRSRSSASRSTISSSELLIAMPLTAGDRMPRAAPRKVGLSAQKLDVIRQVCLDGPGHFLGSDQTLALMQREYVYPVVGDRTSVTS